VFGHEEVLLDTQKWGDHKRNYIAYEILTTEATYVKSLQMCTIVYIEPLKRWIEEFEIPQAKAMLNLFLTLKTIVNVNSVLLNDLRQRFKDWSDKQPIGDLILTIIPYLKMYRSYAVDYDRVVDTISYYRYKKGNKQLINLLWEGETHPINKCVNVESLLILPIQRIPRYVLLLTDLLQNTDKDHPDYDSLEKSTEAMKDVALDINTAIKKAEARAQCLHIQSLFDTKFNTKQLPFATLVEAHRVFIKDGQLLKQCRSERKIRRFFLFNDLLIYAHISGPPTERKLVVDRTFFFGNYFD